MVTLVKPILNTIKFHEKGPL